MTQAQTLDGQQASDKPSRMLEIYMAALNGETGEPLLDRINLGTGNYTTAEYWQQVDSFRAGMFAESALVRKIMERARHEAKEAMVDAIWEGRHGSGLLKHVDFVDPDDSECETREEYFDEYSDLIWEGLGTEGFPPSEHRAYVVHQATGIPMDWEPPHWRMMKMRHEASQSKGARALDNLFSRVKEFRGQDGPLEEFDR